MKYLFLVITALLAFSCASAPPPETFSVSLDSRHHEAGEIEANFDRYLSIGSLRKTPVKVYYYPDEDAVCLQFKVMLTINCQQFWDKAGRDAFIAAFQRYQEDFEGGKLAKANRKTRGVYGKARGFFAWKKTPVSAQAYGPLEYSLGYQFDKKSVFFTATQSEAEFEHRESKSMNQTSPVLVTYYTRAQAESLIALFSQEYLQGLGRPSGWTDESGESKPDVYNEL